MSVLSEPPMTGPKSKTVRDTSRHKKCGAPKRQAPFGPCTRPAGWGTEHPGIGKCKLHGGRSPSHNKAAQTEQARQDVALFGARVDVHPADALLELVQWTAGEVNYWRQEVRLVEREELTWGVTREKTGGEDHGTTKEAKPNIAYVMLVDASNRLERYSSSALRAGVDERQVRIAENQGRLFAGALQQMFILLELDARQLALVPTVVPQVLRALSVEPAGVAS